LLLRNSFSLTQFISDSRERVDQVVREKEKLRSDLDKAEKLKSLMASEVDDHHAAIERRNEYNLRCDWEGEVRWLSQPTEPGQRHLQPQGQKRAQGLCLPAWLQRSRCGQA
jgi:hypothetical protein